MALPTEFSGLLLAIRFVTASGNGIIYKAQRTRVHIHGDTGDVTSGEDLTKKRIGTVPDFEVTITKASYDPANNPFTGMMNFRLFMYIVTTSIFPGGVGTGHSFSFYNAILDDFELDQDANMLEPLSLHMVSGDGSQSPSTWYSLD